MQRKEAVESLYRQLYRQLPLGENVVLMFDIVGFFRIQAALGLKRFIQE